MGVLTREDLEKYIASDDRLVTPLLDWEEQVGEGSVDIRLGPEFLLARRRQLGVVDPTRLAFTQMVTRCQERVTVRFGEALTLHPGDFALGSSLEYLNFPRELMAYVAGRSSWGRLGLVIATAVVVAPTFKGCLTLELANVSTVPVLVYPGWRIAQLVVHRVGEALPSESTVDKRGPGGPGTEERGPETGVPRQVKRATRKYACLVGPNPSRLNEDPEAQYLRFDRRPLVIGICGPDKSGKSVVQRVLVEEQGLVSLPLGRYVRAEIGRRGRRPDPGYYYYVGGDLRSLYGADYLARLALEDMASLAGAPGFVVRGIRHPAEIALLLKETDFYLFMLMSPQRDRYERQKASGSTTSWEQFKILDRLTLGQLAGCFKKARGLQKAGRGCRLINLPDALGLRERVMDEWRRIEEARRQRGQDGIAQGRLRGLPG